jgi:Asp-tRNA(Asn)/Glu-tRNA(Gln) amidotransferase A subunit family amidase
MHIKPAAGAVALAFAALGPAAAAPAAPFPLVEATIAGMHQAMRDNGLTCRQVVQGYLARIQAYDLRGPALRAVITVNPLALDEADRQDALFRKDGLQGPLHCVTLLVKDNVDTAGMPTTGGARAFAGNRPPEDAVVVARLKAAGAIVLAKANLDEFAFTYKGSSSIAGQTLNPYDTGITPGGSSSGTASGVAASMAMAGIGTDTGGSGRVPAAVQGLIGIRPSLRLLSQEGMLPLAHTEDTAAPICRTVEDCALLLQAMRGDATPDYRAGLRADGLRGARIGVVRQLFPAASSARFKAALEQALTRMRGAGAVVEDVQLPDLPAILAEFKTVKPYEFKGDLERYLARWPSDADGHPRSYRQLLDNGGFEERNKAPLAEYDELGTEPMRNPDYVHNVTTRFPRVQASLTRALQGYDVLLYPTRANLNLDQDGKASNNPQTSRLSSWSGYPALAMPVAMVAPEGRAPQPVGIELLAREFDEATLLRIAYGWQQTVRPRRAPALTPELPELPELR